MDVVGRIPVRNVWLLLLYASDFYKCLTQKERQDIENSPDDLPELIVRILVHHVELRLKRNLSITYQRKHDICGRVRGRIDVFKTERKSLLRRGKIACLYDDLTVDTPRNRYVKSALNKAAGLYGINAELAKKCISLARTLSHIGVTGAHPSAEELSKERFDQNSISDLPMLAAAKLVFNMFLPNETQGDKYISLPCRDIVWFRKVFEKGVAGFYKVNTAGIGWRIRHGRNIAWPKEERTVRIDEIFPNMKTDIELYRDEAKIVIDTKFNEVVVKGWRRDETLRSPYIYQMYAYLRSQENHNDTSDINNNATGILLHPAVGEHIDEAVIIQRHEIRFKTVDLTASSKEIKEQLLCCITSRFDVANMTEEGQ